MKNVSSDFRNELNSDNRNYVKSADITLKNGTVLHVDNSDMWSNGLTIEDSTSGENSFDIGSVIIGSATLVLNNIDEDFSEYDFTDCVMSNVKVGLKLPDDTVESLAYGKYYLNEQKYNGSIITLTFYDGISKFDKDYSKSNLQYPATLLQIVQDACSVCGITLGTPEFEKDDYIVQTRPDDDSLTFRRVLQWVAQISCHYCKCDEQGRLCLEWYDTDTLEELTTTGEQTTTGDYHTVSSNSTFTVGLDDVVITGIRVLQDVEGENGTETITYQSGSDGYVLEVSKNQFIQGDNGSAVATYLASKLAGVRFRPFEISCLSDPTIEAGDIALIIDRKGNRYKSIITNNTFNPGNFQRIVCGAETPARQSASRYSQITQVYVDYRKDLKKEKTEREQAIEDLQDRVNNSSGLFTTTEEQPDGSNKFYLHNKPELSESDIIWTMTAEAWTVSTNGGVTVNGGMTVDGDTIVRILNAVGINADWINSGAISIKDADGNETFYADTATGIVRINAQSFSLTGKTVEEIAAEQVNDFVENVYSPTITNLQNQIDGQIETWFEDYIPTNENYPANEWTTDTEKDKHLGDLFYVVDNEEYGGQAYRWALINGEYKWDYVEDTAVVKALADAAKAQDTADQKRRVFVSQPYPPYDVGDLWVGDSTSEMMRCQTARATGSYVASDWIKAVKYTDDANLNVFINGVYADNIKEITEQLDKKAETWYQTTDPALNWTGTEEAALVDHEGNVIVDHEGNTIVALWEKEKAMHNGDLWKNPDTNVEYIYQDGKWIEMQIPNDVFDTIDGKAQIFVSQPVPPYDIGDLWFNSATSDIMTCIQKRETGTYNAADWEKRNKYTDDTYAETVEENLNIFSETVTGSLNNMQEQIDGKIETWYYNYQPTLANIPASQWTTEEERHKHIGDLFYWQDKGFAYRFQQGTSGYTWQPIQDSDITEALNQAAQAQDTADRKRQVFYSTPYPPYDVGDLWAQGADGDIMRCKTARQSGSYVSTDWEKASKYTDDTAVDNLDNELDQQGVFDRLTNYGQAQGLYMNNGFIYLNANYIKSGTLTADYIKGGNLDLTSDIGGSIRVFDILGNQVMILNSNGMIIDPMVEALFGITVGNSLEIMGSGIISKNENGNTSAYIANDFIGVMRGDSPYGHITESYVSIGVNSNKGEITISDPDNFPSVLSQIDADGFFTKGTKSRLVKTVNYGERFQYCYEMPSPMFGDIGSGETDENGISIIDIDEIFSETINFNVEYQVFLQKEGQGDLWVDSKETTFFIVKGTPNLRFTWELKMRQKDFELLRLEEKLNNSDETNLAYDEIGTELVKKETKNQENLAFDSNKYYRELEEMFL